MGLSSGIIPLTGFPCLQPPQQPRLTPPKHLMQKQNCRFLGDRHTTASTTETAIKRYGRHEPGTPQHQITDWPSMRNSGRLGAAGTVPTQEAKRLRHAITPKPTLSGGTR